jgi:dTMP kinase
MQRGVFVSFESSEGCGKSTQIALLRERLTERGVDFLVTREPGGTAIGEKVRDLLQYAPEGEGMSSEAELLLFAASRAQLVREVIEPALAQGRWVLADRFLDSTTVYQGGGRELNADAVQAVNRFAVGGCLPDLTLVLDMDVEAARERAKAASGEEGVHDRMEHLDPAFYERVRAAYLDLVESEPARFKVIAAEATPEVVAEGVWAAISERFDF